MEAPDVSCLKCSEVDASDSAGAGAGAVRLPELRVLMTAASSPPDEEEDSGVSGGGFGRFILNGFVSPLAILAALAWAAAAMAEGSTLPAADTNKP